MNDLGNLLKPASLVRIVLIYLVFMGLYATEVGAQNKGLANWVLVTAGATAVMTIATIAAIAVIVVIGRGGLAASQAGRLRAEGKTEQALARYNQAVTHNPNSAEALVGRAELLAEIGSPAGALIDLDRAIAMTPHVSNFPDPVLGRAYLDRARLRLEAGDLDAAVSDSAQAIRSAPGQAEPHILQGRASLERGDWIEGRSNLATGIRILDHRLNGRVENSYQQALDLNTRGLAYNLLGEPSRALADFERALLSDPKLWVVHYNVGAAYLALGHADAALAALQQAIAFNPSAAAAARRSSGYAALRGQPEFDALVGERF